MIQSYAILDAAGGWLIDILRWDGNLATWQPDEGTIAVPVSEVNFRTLPRPPSEPDSEPA